MAAEIDNTKIGNIFHLHKSKKERRRKMNDYDIERFDGYLNGWKKEAGNEKCPQWKRTKLEEQTIFFADRVKPILFTQSNLMMNECAQSFIREAQRAKQLDYDTFIYVVNLAPNISVTKRIGLFVPDSLSKLGHKRQISINVSGFDKSGREYYLLNGDMNLNDDSFLTLQKEVYENIDS